MKAHVYVTLKRTVLDPQGQTIHGALKRMQYTGVEDVRQGKYFQLTLRTRDAASARAEVERIAREVLTNPVIEEFTYRLEEPAEYPARSLPRPYNEAYVRNRGIRGSE